MRKPALTCLLSAVIGASCSLGTPSFELGEVEFSARPGSGEPNLYATDDGRVILTWFEPLGSGGHALRTAVRQAGAWSAPRTIVEGDRFFVNWADFPSLIELPDGSWVVHWLEKVAESTYAYHTKLAISRDYGLTWSDPIVPHRDDSPTEHGFVAMVPWEAGSAALVWLDGRQMKSGGHPGEPEGLDLGEMSVRSTTITPEGALGPDVLLDERTCECCQTALVRTREGLVAAYRDRGEDEMRDIAVVRFVDGSWTDPVPVAKDGWRYPGCPVNGPQLSASGGALGIAWFTAPEQKPAVYVAFSADAGASFERPVRIDDGEPLGRVDIELLSNGSAIVSWLERTDEAAEVHARLVRRNGTMGGSWLVTETSEARSSGFPRMARVGDEIIFAWTLAGEDGGVRVAAARLGA